MSFTSLRLEAGCLPTACLAPFPTAPCLWSKRAYLLLGVFKSFISLYLLLQLNSQFFCWYMWPIHFLSWVQLE